MVKVWSERVERPGVVGLHDCTYSAVLMALVYGGFVDYPLGIYSPTEREALESSDSRKDETGSTFNFTDEAVRNRYKISMTPLAANEQASATLVRTALRTQNTALAIAGTNARYPAAARNWQPSFTGPHAVCAVHETSTHSRWLDPLAPNGYAGDLVPIDQIISWAFIPSDARVVIKDQYRKRVEDDMLKLDAPIYGTRAVLRPGTVIHSEPGKAWFTATRGATVWPVGSLVINGIKWIAYYVLSPQKWGYVKDADVTEWLGTPEAEDRLEALKRIRRIAAGEINP